MIQVYLLENFFTIFHKEIFEVNFEGSFHKLDFNLVLIDYTDYLSLIFNLEESFEDFFCY